MSWLFGKKKEEKKKPNPEEAMRAINSQIDNIGKREQVLEIKAKNLTQEALKNKKAKNNRAAILALKKKKLAEQELNKIGGMKMLLEQQKLQLEGSAFDGDIFATLKTAGAAITEVRKGIDVEQFEQLKEDIEESQAVSQEISEFFGGIAQEGEDELLDELEQMESENVEEQLGGIDVPVGSIILLSQLNISDRY
eukprot:TRINITY_DN121133_c0_g1_i1.p4 TRINITY_DN121133_c0_g1~~TRINITY_DN121133_c0_g1_i1.p4  ORF type:complete len:195 (-),score=51.12 TRINITY_DN121133_c0_g1_i1:2564-3148(-)